MKDNKANQRFELGNSTPSAVEEALVNRIKTDLDKFSDVVTVKPFLEVDEEGRSSTDLSIKNAYGAIQLKAYDTQIYVPFMIVDKVLMPFDTIRMGDQEVAYDQAKLKKIINGIERKAKDAEEGEDGQEATMEVADIEDIQTNNGFLGTIMNIRDTHRSKDVHGHTPWSGQAFGSMEDARMLQQASADVFDTFHDVMEKMADVTVYTKDQIDDLYQTFEKEAREEVENDFEKLASSQNRTLDEARLERDMIKLDDQKLYNIHRAASGNDVEFPTFNEGRFEINRGRFYKNFDKWNTKSRTGQSKISGVVIDAKGNYRFLKSNEPFMAIATEKPGYFEFPTERGRGLHIRNSYAMETDETTLKHPFHVTGSYNDDALNDGLVLNVRERVTGSQQPRRYTNSLFQDVLRCEDRLSGKTIGYAVSGVVRFNLVIVQDESYDQVTTMNEEQLMAYIERFAEDESDRYLAKNMVNFTSDEETFTLVGPHQPFIKLNGIIEGYYEEPSNVVKETLLKKEAAANSANKARLVLEKSREPKMYTLQWQFAQGQEIEDMRTASLERKEKKGLSEEEARALLGKLGFDHRMQAQFFEMIRRTGRHAIFELPDVATAASVSDQETIGVKAKQKMKGVADHLLNSKNFTPIFEDVIAENFADAVEYASPSTIDRVHKATDFFGGKHAAETAMGMEKVAQSFNKEGWHEISALVNLSYQLDKMAQTLDEGDYLYNSEPVFEKVSELKPTIQEKVAELIGFSREQQKHYKQPLVSDELVKEAIEQLDSLYRYASVSETIGKKKH